MKRIDPFIKEAYSLDDSIKEEISVVNPITLLNKDRLDIIAKLIYLEKKELGIENARDFYLEHIKAMTKYSFVEAGSKKSGKEEFINQFCNLVDSIKENGYSETAYPVPVDCSMKILDGAHRVAAGIYLNKEIPVAKLPIVGKYDTYDYKYFRSFDYNEDYLDEIILRYIELKNNVYCFNVWPSAVGKDEDIKNIFVQEGCNILYYKEVKFNEEGAFNYLSQIYSEFSWAQEDHDGFGGIYRKLVPCFKTFDPVRVYFVEASSSDVVLKMKERIRELFKIDKHSVHATDNYKETLEMGRLLLSQNSIDFMNCAVPLSNKKNIKFINEIRTMDSTKVIIDGSLIMALYGICEAEDIDFLTSDESLEGNHNDCLNYYNKSLNELMFSKQCFFWYFNYKFLTLTEVIEFKKRRDSSKDKGDIELYNIWLKGKNNDRSSLLNVKRWFLRKKRKIIAQIQGVIIKLAHLTGTYNVLRKIYKLLKRA